MKIRYIPADPAGNLTGFVLTAVPEQARAQVALAMMARCEEGFEQIGFIDEASMEKELPRMDMMGGEFCGNATRAFALLCARRRGLDQGDMYVSVSGAQKPVFVHYDSGANEAYAQVPLPTAAEWLELDGRNIPVVRMEGIAHAVVYSESPSQETALRVLGAMPEEDAQGVLFIRESRLIPAVYVRATDALVWESSCGSGSVAAAWLMSLERPDGEYRYTFTEPGGVLHVTVKKADGRAVRAVMGGAVTLGKGREILL